MDESVIRAMAKWPDVPAVFGWLALDRRGRWLLRGERIGNRNAVEFICRNYACDGQGRWYFQNGPQRVYVALEYTPWVLVLAAPGGLVTHTGRAVGVVTGAWLDEEGRLLLGFDGGVGLLDERDLPALGDDILDRAGNACEEEQVAAFLEGGARGDLVLRWHGTAIAIEPIRAHDCPRRFGYDPEPGENGRVS